LSILSLLGTSSNEAEGRKGGEGIKRRRKDSERGGPTGHLEVGRALEPLGNYVQHEGLVDLDLHGPDNRQRGGKGHVAKEEEEENVVFGMLEGGAGEFQLVRQPVAH